MLAEIGNRGGLNMEEYSASLAEYDEIADCSGQCASQFTVKNLQAVSTVSVKHQQSLYVQA